MPRKTLIDVERQSPSPEQVKTKVARAVIAALTKECKSYCMLSGYENLPDSFDTDIDFMVDSEDFERMPQIIEQIALQTNTRLFHSVEHEITARSYSLAAQSGSKMTVVQPDSTCDYRHFGSLWLRADEVLAARVWHPRGFYIPAPAHEFAYYMIKRLNKRYISPEHGLKLHRLYLEDVPGCDGIMARFWKGQQQSLIREMAASNDWTKMNLSLESVRGELMQNTGESASEKLAFSSKHAVHFMRRMTQPTGGWVALMGPDGSGKSAIISAISQQFTAAYREVRLFHLRPKSLRRHTSSGKAVTDPHGRPPRGLLASLAKGVDRAADYFVGYFFQVAPAMRRSQLIIFDRYIYDLLVDSKRIRYGGPAWLLRLVARIVPRPDLVILLDAPAEVLWSRKQEVPFEEVVRQRAAYLDVARNLSSTVIVNADQPLSAVIHDVDCAIVDYFARRAAARLNLQDPTLRANEIEVDAASHRC